VPTGLEPISEYLNEEIDDALSQLENIGQEKSGENNPVDDTDIYQDSERDFEWEHEDAVDRIGDAREMLVVSRRLLREFQSGEYAGVQNRLERALSALQMAREVLEGPALEAIYNTDQLNRLKEKNLAKQARIQKLIELFTKVNK